MWKFDKHPIFLRMLAGLFVAFLATMAVLAFVKFAGSPTDENVFALPPVTMTLYVTRAIPASPVSTADRAKDAMDDSGRGPAVRVGDLINLVKRKPVFKLDEMSKALASVPPDSNVTIDLYRPGIQLFIKYHIKPRDLPDSAVAFLKDYIVVTDVTPGGASDRAGMKVGDLIRRINGQEFQDAVQADNILRHGQSGKAITYEVLRNNEQLTLHVTLAQFGFPLTLLVFSLSGMFMLSVGAFITLKRPQIRAARVEGLSLLMLGFFITIVLLRRDADVDTFVSVRDFCLAFTLLFGVAMTGWSTALFPKERPDLLGKDWIPLGGCLLATLGLALQFLWGTLVLVVSFGAIALYYIIVRFVHRKNSTPEHKRLSRVISVTAVLVTLWSIGVLVFAAIIRRASPIGLVGIALFAIPLAHLYTIGRYRLLDLKLRVKRNVQYSLVSIVWGIVLAAVLVGVFMSLPRIDMHLPAVVIHGTSIEVRNDAEMGLAGEWTNRVVLMTLGVVLWYLLWRLRRGGQAWIDRKYNRTQYDYRVAVKELGEVLAKKLSLADLGEGLAHKLAELVRVKRAGVFFFREGIVSGCQEASGIGQTEWDEFCTPVAAGLAPVLSGAGEQIQSDYLPATMKEVFRKHEFQLLVPVRSKDRLLGAMVLGEKLSESTYSPDDFAFLTAAAQQASVAMDNAFLYEELAEKERMKHELQIARRIQLASLPQHTPAVKGLDIAGISAPALEVGGDFFDYLNGAGDKLTLIVGDVSGKGTSAALYMSKVQGILRSLHGFGLSPADLFIRANRLLCTDMEKKSFVTAVGGAFNPQDKSLILARAGHLPLYLFRAEDGSVEKITPRGLGLGLNDAGVFSSELEEKLIRYAPGDVLLFLTDGITEAQNSADELFGEERVMASLANLASGNAAMIRDALLREVKAFTGEAHQHDDETIVVVKAT